MQSSNVTAPHLDSDHRTLAFPLICLVFGLILDAGVNRFQCGRKFNIPSTVFQLCVSIVLSATAHNFLQRWTVDYIRQSFTWMDLDPHITMHVLLPILIFESAFRLEAHTLKALIGIVLILAVFGFLMSAAQLGVLMYGILAASNETWTIPVSFAYGTLISATDPVAVVAILDDLGAPLELKVVIEGESLLNDGAAILVFGLVKNEILPRPDQEEWQHLIPFRILGVMGSMLIGYVAARLVVWLLLHAFIRDIKKEIGILFVTVYIVFIASERIHGSGVLALVIFGVSMGSRKDQMNPETVEEILHLYAFLAYWANCIIFILTGLIIGDVIQRGQIKPFGVGLLAYIFSLVSRGSVFLIFGAVNYWREKRKKVETFTSAKTYFFMGWAGLRGAVALLLALQLNHINEKATKHVMLYAAMTVFFSIFIQGTSAGPVIQCLRLAKRSWYGRKRLRTHLKDLRNELMPLTVRNFQCDEKYYFLGGANWEIVKKIASDACSYTKGNGGQAETDEVIPGLAPQTERSYSSLDSVTRRSQERPDLKKKKKQDSESASLHRRNKTEQEALARDTYMHLLLARSWRMWKEGLLNKRTIRLLVHSIEHDMVNGRLLDVDNILLRSHCSPLVKRLTTIFSWMRKKLTEWNLVVALQYPRAKDWYYIASFSLLMIQCGLVIAFLKFEMVWILYIIFVLSAVFALEQAGLFFRLLNFLSFPREFCQVVWVYADFIFGIYYALLTIVTGVALTKERQHPDQEWYCFSSDGENTKFKEMPVCSFTKWMLAICFLRLFIRFMYSFRLLIQLLAAHLEEFEADTKMMTLACLNTILRITEELDHGALFSALSKIPHMVRHASCYNKSLRDHAERILVSDLRKTITDMDLIRLVQTRQASRGLLVALRSEVDNLSFDGTLTEEEHEYLTSRLLSAFARVEQTRDYIPPSSLSDQLIRVPWINKPNGDRTTEELLEFLLRKMKMPITLKPGQYIFEADDAPDGMYFIKDGFCLLIRISKFSRHGKPKEKLIHAGNFVGDRVILSKFGKHEIGRSASVLTATECTVYHLPTEYVEELKAFDPSIVETMARKQSVTKCSDRLRKHVPYVSWTNNQLEELIHKILRKTTYKQLVELPRHKCAIFLSGSFHCPDEFLDVLDIPPTEHLTVVVTHSFTVAPIEGEDTAFYCVLDELKKMEDAEMPIPLTRSPSTEFEIIKDVIENTEETPETEEVFTKLLAKLSQEYIGMQPRNF